MDFFAETVVDKKIINQRIYTVRMIHPIFKNNEYPRRGEERERSQATDTSKEKASKYIKLNET